MIKANLPLLHTHRPARDPGRIAMTGVGYGIAFRWPVTCISVGSSKELS